MYQPTGSVQSAIVSRVCAVLLIALLLAAVGVAIERQDVNALEKLTTYDELRAYHSASLIGGYWACFGIATIFGFGYLALVEGLGYVLRLLIPRARRTASTEG